MGESYLVQEDGKSRSASKKLKSIMKVNKDTPNNSSQVKSRKEKTKSAIAKTKGGQYYIQSGSNCNINLPYSFY